MSISPPLPLNRTDVLRDAALALALAAVAHVLFSPLGFHPTDDGFTLAYARRLLDGQVPHRDFVIIRPALSPLLHAPVVALGGAHTYLASRALVWGQFALFAALWTALLVRAFGPGGVRWPARAMLVAVAFMASVHTFPITAWHTLDALVLVALGLWALERPSRRAQAAGAVLVGLAYLCKQNFLLVGPLVLALDPRLRGRAWQLAAAWAAPGMAYVLGLVAAGALPEAWAQLSSQSGLVRHGVLAFVQPFTLAGVAAGMGGAWLLARLPTVRWAWGRGAVQMGWMLGPGLAFAASWGGWMSPLNASFVPFGLLVGLLLFDRLVRPVLGASERRWIGIVLVVAWSASVSLGYNAPALVVGPVLVALVLAGGRLVSNGGPVLRAEPSDAYRAGIGPVQTWALALLVLGMSAAFWEARMDHIYREAPASRLTSSLDGVLPGGAGLRTNAATHAFLLDLRRAAEDARRQGLGYAVVPDGAGWWAKAPQPNPLPLDWPQQTELAVPHTRRRVYERLDALRGTHVVLVQRVEARTLAERNLALDTARYAVVRHVRQRFTKVGETAYFEVYR